MGTIALKRTGAIYSNTILFCKVKLLNNQSNQQKLFLVKGILLLKYLQLFLKTQEERHTKAAFSSLFFMERPHVPAMAIIIDAGK